MAASLETFATLAPCGRRVAVLGGMLELGAESARLHRAVGRTVARLGVDLLVTVGEEARPLAAGVCVAGLTRVREVASAEHVVAVVVLRLAVGWTVLFKGSRGVRLERAHQATCARLAPTTSSAARRRAA